VASANGKTTTASVPRMGGPGGRPGGGPGGRGRVAEKPADFGGTMVKLISYNKRYIPAILVSVLFAAAGSFLNVVGPHFISKITDIISAGLTGPMDIAAASRVAWMLVGLYLLGFVLNVVEGLITTNVAQRSSQRMRADLARKIDRLPLGYFHDTSTGDVLSRMTNDVPTASDALTQSLGSLVSSLATLVGSAAMMLVTSIPLALAGMASAVVGFVLMLFVVKASQKLFVAQQSGLGSVNGHVEETLSGQQVMRLYNGQAQARRTFKGLNDDLYSTAWKSQVIGGIAMPLMSLMGNISYVVVCVYGAALALDGVITFGVIVAFMLYVRQFSQPLSQISNMLTNLQSAAAAGERFFQFMDADEMEDETGKPDFVGPATGDVEFDHVRFGYEPGKTIIHDLSVHAYPGQKIAIVGPTGAGKSTLVNLLMRFYELDGGQIRIDGQDISAVTRQSVRDQFAMVLQESWLFEGTVRENIAFGNEEATQEEIEAACEAVGLTSYINTLPNGYDTILSEDGDISAGQRQMVTIVRAMLQDAPMLILDEATSSVDTRTEQVIQRAMDALMEERTSFVIAHRLSTIRNAGYILVMKDGDVIERGNHEELMAEGGFYAELYQSQFEQG